jgi:hypothetical protein
MNDPSGDFLSGLAGKLDRASLDLSDGHVRWNIYRQAMDMPSLWPELLDVVPEEPDLAIASSVVLGMLGRTPEGMREKWVELLPPGRPHDVAATRAREIGILESFARQDPDAPLDLPAPDSWSNWLQLRLATSVNVKVLLDLLARQGRTRRIRASASEHLRRA